MRSKRNRLVGLYFIGGIDFELFKAIQGISEFHRAIQVIFSKNKVK
jgi:hypothetical protein